MRPTAAPPWFPYAHRNLKQVDALDLAQAKQREYHRKRRERRKAGA